MTGTSGAELEFTFAFTPDGQGARCVSARMSDRELPTRLRKELLDWLGDGATEKLIAEAWRDAEPEQDDWHSDDSRMPGAAE